MLVWLRNIVAVNDLKLMVNEMLSGVGIIDSILLIFMSIGELRESNLSKPLGLVLTFLLVGTTMWP